MQPIIRRTVTITITETWTITWPDGHETVWHEAEETIQPASSESVELLPPIRDQGNRATDEPMTDTE